MTRYEVQFYISSMEFDSKSEKEAIEYARKEFRKEVNKKGTFMIRRKE